MTVEASVQHLYQRPRSLLEGRFSRMPAVGRGTWPEDGLLAFAEYLSARIFSTEVVRERNLVRYSILAATLMAPRWSR
jgi:hypothetical protein